MTNDDFANPESIMKKDMVMFYLIDTSGSMDGTKINSVNTVMDEVCDELLTVGGANAEIRVAALTFDSQCRWMNNSGPVSAEDFKWIPVSANGLTSMGQACRMLNEKLSRSVWLKAPHESYAPVIFLLSDGGPTDNFESGLAELKNNDWFNNAVKVALAIGQQADKECLAKFTGNMELVVTVNSGKALMNMIRTISVQSAKISSKKGAGGAGNTPGTVNTAARDQQLIQAIQNAQTQSADDIVDGEF